MKKTQNGNVLFLILIAVALFAAVSYAVTKSGRGSGSISRETAAIAASQLIAYAGTVQQAVNRLVLTGGCTDVKLNAYNANFANSADYVNAAAPPDKSCNIFDPAGGGVVWERPPASIRDPLFPEYGISGDVLIKNVGTSANELIIVAKVPKEVCMQINTKLGIPTTGGNPPGSSSFMYGSLDSGTNPAAFNGTYAVSSSTELGDYNGPALAGKLMGCYTWSIDPAGGFYGFYSLLLAR